MFQNWGFLLTEIWLLVLIAALLGLLVGWLIWGRASVATDSGEAARLRGELDACQSRSRDLQGEAARLRADLEACRSAAVAAAPAAAAAPVVAPAAAVVPAEAPAEVPADSPGTKPVTLAAPREGGADDLKLISGIGPKLEKLCNELGFWHFDQIANWTPEELAWVDHNLEGFKGRIQRDNWIEQARALAAAKG
jgi:predicted flap endonuclease-1-like 5' DNA nuclease